MNKTLQLNTLVILTCSLLLNSCAEMGPAMENLGAMAGGGAALGAIIGGATGHGGRDSRQRAAIGGLIGAGAGALVSLAYKASVQQQSQARERANRALTSNRSIMKSVNASGAKYVVVPVKAKQGAPDSKSRMVKVRVQRGADGALSAGDAGGTAYPTVAADNGDVVRVGGSEAVYLEP